jgi:hypothetical protein
MQICLRDKMFPKEVKIKKMKKIGFAKLLWLKTVYLILTFRKHFAFSKSALIFSIFLYPIRPFSIKKFPSQKGMFQI